MKSSASLQATLAQWMPILAWLPRYRREDLSGDLLAGTITAILLVPQAMAYSLLAGLPPEVGLYASIAPPLVYALFGSSRTLAVGPVAVASLLVAASLGDIAAPGSPEYYAAALLLALMTGLILLILGVARAGFVANFLSHPVMSGFTSAAAIMIIVSQLKHLLGIPLPRAENILHVGPALLTGLGGINPVALGLGLVSIAGLVYSRKYLGAHLRRLGLPAALADPLTKTGPLVLVILATGVTWLLALDQRVALNIVGGIPTGLPPIGIPPLSPELWRELAGAALLIALVGFVESVSVAKVLASKRRQKVDPDQELVGLGMANLGAAFSGGSPVCGGFSRSVVNYSAGANTQLAAIVTAGFIALAVVFLTPFFYYLPQTVLAAIIIVAVSALIDTEMPRRVWHYNKADAASLAITFVVVLTEGIETGIVAGVLTSLALYLWRTSRPHIAVVGRVGDSEHFRNVERHPVHTCPHILAVRVDESLYFANTRFLENFLLAGVAEQPEVRHVVLICSALNYIDASALESLENLILEFRGSGVTLHLAEVKGPVTDKLHRTPFLAHLAPGKLFLSTDEAMAALGCPGPALVDREASGDISTTPVSASAPIL